MTSSGKSKFIFFGLAGATLLIGIIIWNHSREKDDQVYVEVRTLHTDSGWGYDILTDGKTYIHQIFIPAVAGKHAFKTREDALKVGRKVISKISSHQLPTISTNELKEMGIVIDSMAQK